jgi:hypothetical protein
MQATPAIRLMSLYKVSRPSLTDELMRVQLARGLALCNTRIKRIIV